MLDSRITGRRPNRSDRAPCTGEAISCITAQTVPNTPKIRVVWESEPPLTCWISWGITGITIPMARTSSTMVMKMKIWAARRGPRTGFSTDIRSPSEPILAGWNAPRHPRRDKKSRLPARNRLAVRRL